VTGNSLNGNSPRKTFLTGPDPATATQIYSALVSDLSKVSEAYLFFTAYNIASYEVKGGLKNREAALKGKGSITIGGTIFSITT
jgi:hypothetical protein